jgi:ribose transport system substrate-binding protein
MIRTLNRRRTAAVFAGVGLLALSMTACNRDGTAAEGEQKVVLGLSFPCGLNEYSTLLCQGAEDAGKDLPEGYSLDIKTGVDYADNVAFNNLLQTSLQTKPAGFIVFPAGPAAQTPVLNQACDQGVEVLIIDSPAEGVDCQAGFVGANHEELGASVGEWLAEHPPATKEIGIVTQPPGQYASTDARVKGFTEAVAGAGYTIAATVTTDLSLDKTRTVVTNMITAHPDISAVFSANGPMGQGTAQALKEHPEITQLTLDGFVEDAKLVASGEVAANGAQNPYQMGQLAVESMVKVLEGETIPEVEYTTSLVIDQSNAEEYIEQDGMH